MSHNLQQAHTINRGRDQLTIIMSNIYFKQKKENNIAIISYPTKIR